MKSVRNLRYVDEKGETTVGRHKNRKWHFGINPGSFAVAFASYMIDACDTERFVS